MMEHSANNRRAILIDLDGTLVDSAPDIAEAVRRMLIESGVAPLPFDTVRSFIGNGVPNLIRRVLAASAACLGEPAAMALFLRHYRDTNGRFGHVYPGVREGLQALQKEGFGLACVTNKPLAPTIALLAAHDLAPWFKVVVAGDSLDLMKPDPAPLLHACRGLDASPAHCVMVGDSTVDVAAARAARMPVYIMRYGYPGPDGHAGMQCDALIDSFTELPAILAAQQRAPADAYLHSQGD